MDGSLELDHGAFDLHADQHILEEDYDENYEPTEEGAFLFGCYGHASWVISLDPRIESWISSIINRNSGVLQDPWTGSNC